MPNYYLKYELSQSLNGKKIVHIARNAAGNVVFREPSEEKLKKAIDAFEEKKKREEEEKEKVLAERAKAKEERAKGKKKLTNKLQEAVQEKATHLEGEAQDIPSGHLPGEQPADGESESPASPPNSKKSFWDKLK